MTLTENKYSTIKADSSISPEKDIDINLDNPFLENDLGIIIHAYEKSSQQWVEEDYNKVYLYRDVYNTEHFSQRTREQLDYYPGMHQSENPPEEDPFYTNAKQQSDDNLQYWNNALESSDSFNSGLKSRQGDFDYRSIFGSDATKEERAKNIGQMITECVPCFNRLLDMNELLPDADLLEIHLLNIKVRSDMIDKLKELFRDPGLYIDICSLLDLLSHLCPSDLIAITALLTQYLAKLNLEIEFNLDFVMQLVGPILSPFLDALSEWLDKWIQVILNPLICVLDHINATIITAQQAKIPFSEVGANVTLNRNSANPFHNNSSNKYNTGFSTGLGDSNDYAFEDGTDPYAGAWGSYEQERFNTPDKEKYNPTKPVPPTEETEMASREIKEAWHPTFTDEERKEQDEKWKKLRQKQDEKVNNIPPPLQTYDNNGTRWSKDDIPNSEKSISGNSFEVGYHPPEKQIKTKPASEYFVTTPLVSSIVELRNIMQGGIQYVEDWFQYVTQMTYDLIGTDIGWMNKKTDRTVLKSRIIQLIFIIKAIREAKEKNGLECGTESNYDESQMKYILEDGMNQYLNGTDRKFEVKDNGDVVLIKTNTADVNNIKTNSNKEDSKIGTPSDTITNEKIEQTSIDAVLVKDCFKNVSKSDLEEVRKWIADFESKR